MVTITKILVGKLWKKKSLADIMEWKSRCSYIYDYGYACINHMGYVQYLSD